MLKKILSAVLCFTMVITMAGCGSNEKGEETKAATAAAAGQEVEDVQETSDIKVGFAIKTQDSPYFVSLVEAVKKLSQEKGWKCTVLDKSAMKSMHVPLK